MDFLRTIDSSYSRAEETGMDRALWGLVSLVLLDYEREAA
jgi:hypothetical protein